MNIDDCGYRGECAYCNFDAIVSEDEGSVCGGKFCGGLWDENVSCVSSDSQRCDPSKSGAIGASRSGETMGVGLGVD